MRDALYSITSASSVLVPFVSDSHTTDFEEGKAMLHQETFPGQIPYRCLLPQGVDNLLVPVCLSATHVAWGTVRLEPVSMQTGESAGVAATLALKSKTTPAQLPSDQLLRRLCELRSILSFFNDVNWSDSMSKSASNES